MAQTINIEANTINDFLASIDFKNPSWDLLLITLIVVAAILYGISLGRDRLVVILVSIYMALAIVQALPDVVLSIKVEQVFAFNVTTFIGVFLILFFLLSRSALLRTLGARASRGKLWQIALFSLLHIGLIVSIVLTYLPPEALGNFSPVMQQVFVDDWSRFFWITAPVLGMFLVKSEVEE